MGYLEGFGVTLRQHRLFGGKRLTTNYSGGRAAEQELKGRKHGAPADRLAAARRRRRRQVAKPERLHGRHVLNRYEDGMEKCIGCELCAGVCPAQVHLRARRRQRPRRPDVAGRAVRLRLRDQLPPLHPLRPVRRGVPDRGDHRVEAVRVLVHQPPRRRSTPRPSCSSTTTASPSTCRGRTGARARTSTRAAGCAPRRRPATPTSSARSAGAASSATASSAEEPRRDRVVT